MKRGFLDRLIERLERLDPKSLQTHFLALSREKGLLEAIFQAIQEGVIMLDGEGRIKYANRAAERLMGFSLETAEGRPIARYLRDIEWARILDLDAGEWHKLISHEIEVNYPEHRFLTFYAVPLAIGSPGDAGAVVILRDVTRDREQEASVRESDRMNAVTLLAAGVAHEIGNPLNSLHIHLQLFDRELRKLSDAERTPLQELVNVAKDEVSRLDLIITEFLRAIRPARLRRAPARLEVILKETLALLHREMEDRNVLADVRWEEPMPRVMADRNQIKQAFFNVIRNAIQAMPGGGTLTITGACADRFASVSFQDNGTGISPEHFSRVFEPYYTTKPGGSGLGLMIVQRIVQDHGGRIDVHTVPGAGTTFTLLLPLDERRVRLLKAGCAGGHEEEEAENEDQALRADR